MSCDDFSPFIDAYLDQEFDDRERADMEAHLSMCLSCRRQVDVQMALRTQIKRCLSDVKAPADLRSRILCQLETSSCEAAKARATESSRKLMRYGWIAGPLAAAIALVVLLPTFTVAPAESGELPVIEQTVDWHQGNYPLEVITSSPAEISGWFRGRVDFSVRPPHFPSHSANLLGGRIAHVEDRRAAYLLYEVDGQRMSVLLFQGDGLKVPAESVRTLGPRDVVMLKQKGVGVAVLQDSGVTYTFTSELPESRLANLVQAAIEH